MTKATSDNTPSATVESAPAKSPHADIPVGFVRVRITKMGNNKVSTGERYANQDVNYRWQDEAIIDRATAEALEGRGFAEIYE